MGHPSDEDAWGHKITKRARFSLNLIPLKERRRHQPMGPALESAPLKDIIEAKKP